MRTWGRAVRQVWVVEKGRLFVDNRSGTQQMSPLIANAIAKGWIKLPTTKPDYDRNEYMKAWKRQKRAKFYAKGLNWKGQPRQRRYVGRNKLNLGVPSSDRAAYMRAWRKTFPLPKSRRQPGKRVNRVQAAGG